MNKNVQTLANLYDAAMKHLLFIVEKRGLPALDEATQTQVKWVGEIAKTLLVVNQVESARMPNSDATIPPPNAQPQAPVTPTGITSTNPRRPVI